MYLVGDIGGTKTCLALIDDSYPIKPQNIKRFPSSDYKGLLEIIHEYLKEFSAEIKGASFGVAGPVKEGKVQATNLPWVIDSKQISSALDIKETFLLNDLEANAYGLFVLEEKDFYVLNEGKPLPGNQALISAGTGLGEAGIFFDGKAHIPFACEGGHCDFAPRNDLEVSLFNFARQTFSHVSYERFLSGQGIELIYNFLLEDKNKEMGEKMEKLFKENDPAEVISKKALSKEDPICEEALDLFISIYGAEAGNVALKFLSLNGIFIGGGIAPKILEKLKGDLFFKAFKDKGRFEKMLEAIPIKIVLNDQAALLGAGEYILRKNK